ncbi:hypothetical protein MPER_04007 [Moniliophthora perniciosa FA553]|nr:hypothetical protein MPER_04007 [Moniliophthora perniciosa FA553]
MLANEKMRQIFESTAERKAELAQKYGVKLEVAPAQSSTLGAGTPSQSAQAPTPNTPSPSVTKLTTNGLSPAVSNGVHSAASSDAESSKSPSTPRSAKKNKKRK